jgi:hypothetical protein
MAVDEQCSHTNSHTMGVFCRHSRGILMPWGADLPSVHDDRGEEILKAPEGTLLDGVRVRSGNAIATLSTIAYLEVTRQPRTTIAGMARLEERYPTSAQAGRRVAQLWNAISQVTYEDDPVPNFYDIIHRALLEPPLTEGALQSSLFGEQIQQNIPRHYSEENVRRGLRGEGLGPRQPEDSQSAQTAPGQREGTGAGHDSDQGDGEDARENGMDDEELSESKMGMKKRKVPKANDPKWNAPAIHRKWEFVPGTDLEPAELGKPNPSKFFLVRQNKNNPLEKDICQFGGWETLDWDDQSDIDSLNRARRQVRMRTQGKIADTRLPWTQMEKDVLKNLVGQAINTGKNRLNIDWDEISRDMSKRFEGIIQQSGQPMPQTTKLVGGNEVPPKHKPKSLKSVRNGMPERLGSAIKNQAERYGDIWSMLLATKPLGKKVRRKREPTATMKEVEEETEQESDAKPIPKKRRLAQRMIYLVWRSHLAHLRHLAVLVALPVRWARVTDLRQPEPP